jgi:hypothetical protein
MKYNYINNLVWIYALQNSIFPCILPQNREFRPVSDQKARPRNSLLVRRSPASQRANS